MRSVKGFIEGLPSYWLPKKERINYSATISWIRCKVSFAVLRTALLCLRGSRTLKRVKANLIETDFELDNQRYA